MLTQVLNAIGLSTAAEAAAWKARAEKLEVRAGELQQQVHTARERERELKTALHDRDVQLEQARADAQRAERDSAKLAERTEQLSTVKVQLEQVKNQTRELEHDNKRLNAQIVDLEERAREARINQEALAKEVTDQRTRADKGIHAARLGREQLMAMEVKLDLIEAAIRVLDTRLRTADPVIRP